ncbi:MAG: NAD(P)-dependent alcohol dehydrogenase [Chloroflexi bacterium]|nr:MAG: NAD(P)-dependent alcohol dehydrogenase [Chloroflexota bacterium]
MKAAILTQYGGPEALQLGQLPKPIPADNQILVRVRAHSVNYGDVTVRNFPEAQFNMPSLLWLPSRLAIGWRKPRQPILGSEFSGEVEAVGQGVTRFKVGDAVFGYLGQNMGASAEYLCVAEDGLVALKPANMSHEEAAVLPYGALTALTLLRRVDIQPGQKVLINGASGGIGSAAVQLAKHYGAEVTGVCSTERIAFVKALGADKVIDYTQEDFTESGEAYDVVMDILGRSSFAQVKKVLKPQGRYLLASFKMKQVFQMLMTARGGGQKVICALSTEKQNDLVRVKELAEMGALVSIIDRRYPLAQIAEAHRYIESGQKQGHIAIQV